MNAKNQVRGIELTMTLNPHAVEHLVETITKQVLLRLAEEERTAKTGQSLCERECADGLCVQMCVDRVGTVIAAGADRITASLGAIPPTRSIGALIDHTYSSPKPPPIKLLNCATKPANTVSPVCV